MDTTQKDDLFADHLDSGADTHPSYSKIALDSHPPDESNPLTFLQGIINHLNIFEQRIEDLEYKLVIVNETDRRIEELLNRQLRDGLISYADFLNLDHVRQLWVSTSAAFATYNLGCKSSKRQILANLVDLFTLNEISKDKLLSITLEL